MNPSQKLVSDCMNHKIHELKDCMNRLCEHDCQPAKDGNVYNGMLKSSVDFEITHMEHLRDELVDLLGNTQGK